MIWFFEEVFWISFNEVSTCFDKKKNGSLKYRISYSKVAFKHNIHPYVIKSWDILRIN